MGLVCPFEKFLWSDMQELDEARKLAGRRIDVVVEVSLFIGAFGLDVCMELVMDGTMVGGKVWIRDGCYGLG